MRLALIADIHGNLAALEAVAADMERRGVERVVNLGDHLSGPLLAKETARFLRARDWVNLAGNHDRHLVTLPRDRMGASDRHARDQLDPAELDWLRALPPTARPMPGLFACHGTPASDEAYLLETIHDGSVRLSAPGEIAERLGGERAGLVACGHTHVPRVVRLARGQVIANPGSVGLQAYTDDGAAPHVVEVGSPDARYALAEEGPGGWVVTLFSVAYDHEPMARLAERNARPDWALALRTGRVRQGVSGT